MSSAGNGADTTATSCMLIQYPRAILDQTCRMYTCEQYRQTTAEADACGVARLRVFDIQVLLSAWHAYDLPT
jgi:hypothetical protein